MRFDEVMAKTILHVFLADSTNGHAIGTLLHPSS